MKHYDIRDLCLTHRTIVNLKARAPCVIALDFIGYVANISDIRKNTLMFIDTKGQFIFADAKTTLILRDKALDKLLNKLLKKGILQIRGIEPFPEYAEYNNIQLNEKNLMFDTYVFRM